MKHTPVELGATMTGILMGLTKKKKCAWGSESVAGVAKALLTQFYMLRFDEFLFVFRKGLAGGYGKVTFAELEESDLSQWITSYMESDRIEAEEIERSKSRPTFQQTRDDIMDLVPKEKFAEMAKAFDMKSKIDKNNERPAITHESIDRNNLATLQGLWLKKLLTEEDLKRYRDDAQENNFPETLKFCNDEIQARAKKAAEKNEAQK